MKAQHVLYLHTMIFAVFAVSAISSPVLAIFYPSIFASYLYAIIAGVLLGATMFSWKLFKGCPFTVWENRLRAIEQKELAYLGSCLSHYGNQWLGLKLPAKVYSLMLYTMLVMPVSAGVIGHLS